MAEVGHEDFVEKDFIKKLRRIEKEHKEEFPVNENQQSCLVEVYELLLW